MRRVAGITRDFNAPADTITLDETARHRRRMKMVSDNGTEFLLDLPSARLLRHGDGLLLETGEIIQVQAQAEKLYIVRGRNLRHLLSLAWQLGNRHLPAQISDDAIYIRRDHVIKDMLIGLGAQVEDHLAPFDPEGGAYEGQHEHIHQGAGHRHHGQHSHD